MFDASECLRYPATLAGNPTFTANGVVGSAGNPAVVVSSNLLLRDIPLTQGWNWISFNLGFPDPNIEAVLANLPSPTNDLIKDQSKFATGNNNGSWNGSLKTMTNKTLYLYQANQPNTIKMVGNPITPASTPIPVVSGWNWIGYIPDYPLPVNAALATLPAQPGDLIKSQTAFAQYISSSAGWVGNLSEMRAPNGYLLKMTQAGTLIYPAQLRAPDGPVEARDGDPGEPLATFWSVNPAQYEHSMTLIGMFRADSANATTANMELGAFAGNEVRGATQAVYIESLHAYLFFLTVYANTGGELLHFKLYDSAAGSDHHLDETMYFTPNEHQGSIGEPVPFGLQYTATDVTNAVQTFDIQPNPFHAETSFRFVLSRAQEISLSIFDGSGREVYTAQTLAAQGLNEIAWNGISSAGARLDSGVYFVRLITEQGMSTKRLVLQR